MFRTKIAVRYCETDSMGVVHHSRYFPWFEVGRTEFFKTSGMSYKEVEEHGVLLPLIDCYAKFIRGACYQDDVWVEVELKSISVAKCKFDYKVIRCSDEELLAVGYTNHGFTDKNFNPMNLFKKHPDIYKCIAGLKENDSE